MTEVYAADRQGQLDTLTGDRALLNAKLWDAVKNWTPTSAPAKQTRRRYATSFATLERSAVLKADATVGDLAGVDWRALGATWKGGASDWNHLRRAVSRFLSLYLGDVHHPMRRAVVKAIPTRKETSRVPDLPHFIVLVHRASHARVCSGCLRDDGCSRSASGRVPEAHQGSSAPTHLQRPNPRHQDC